MGCVSSSSTPPNTGFFGIGYAVQGYAPYLQALGANWVKVPLVAWGLIEKTPPREGKHFYDWTKLDKIVREYENAHSSLLLVVKASSPWASEKFAGWRKSYPPKKEYWDDYYAFINALVERYDGDGYNDMPGLRYPVLYYEIESEAEHPCFWAGTDEEYIHLLKTAYTAAKAANPNCKIVLAGINLRGDPINFPHQYQFIRKTLLAIEWYDAIDYHYNGNYTDAYVEIRTLRKLIPHHKEIMAGDVSSIPLISNQTILRKIAEGDPNTIRWLRKTQASIIVKKTIIAADLNMSKVFIESVRDFPITAYPHLKKECWWYAGLLNDDRTPRLGFYAYQFLISKLKDFRKVERIITNENNTYLYKIIRDNGSVLYVAWHEKGTTSLSLSQCERIIVQPLLGNAQTTSTIRLNSTPVFIECG